MSEQLLGKTKAIREDEDGEFRKLVFIGHLAYPLDFPGVFFLLRLMTLHL